MIFAAIQLSSQSDVSLNLATAARLVERAAERGAEVILLPEAFAYLGPDAGRRKIAEQLGKPSPLSEMISNWAQVNSVHLIAGGVAEVSEDAQRPYNSSVVFDAQGRIVDVYRKIHLFDVELPDGTVYSESDTTCPGEEPVVSEILGRKVGLSICYDLRFPELYTELRNKGAEIMTVPAAFTRATGRAHWEVLLRARAIETQSWCVAAAQEGEHPGGRKTYGHTMIVDPWGKVVTQMTEAGPGFVIAELPEKNAIDVRERMPTEKHRRLRPHY
jgi:predicted amidohydrolase